MRIRTNLFVLVAATLSIGLINEQAAAEILATVDRTAVELNESFTLKVIVDAQLDAQPDMRPLADDFLIASSSNISNTMIVNGDVNRSRTWTYVLMAKHDGFLTIPSITVGNERSNPVSITVTPQSTAAPGEADIFVTAEVDNEQSYVQAQILYTVRTYRAVATRQPRWSEPATAGVDSLVHMAGEEKNYESKLNGRAYNVIERVYAFFPQQSGALRIEPARFEARVLRDGRITGRKIFQSEPIVLNVSPIPPPPADYPDAAWFPAKAVELSQEWSRDTRDLKVGEPITRHVTIMASGQLHTQIPVIEPTASDNVRIYPDKPEVRTVAGVDGLVALRSDQYALIGTLAGEVVLPELVLPWWNLEANQWQLARLPATSLDVLPSPNEPVEVAPPPVAERADEGSAETVIDTAGAELWRGISMGLFVAWMTTLLIWWSSRRPRREPEPAVAQPVPPHKLQARYLKAARKAAHAGDAPALKQALLEWGRVQWPNDAPRNIGDLAARVSMPLSVELYRLCGASYGRSGDGWDGEAVAKALRSFAVLSDDEVTAGDEELPPLLPNNTA